MKPIFTKPDFLSDSAFKDFNDIFYTTSEMNYFESSFLSGLIKKYNPKKILEVGLAAGGSSCVILNTLKEMDSDAKLYSLDLSPEYYQDKSKPTAFLVDEIVPHLKDNWTLTTGKVLPQVINEIGNEIDFAILDTTHCAPGELLDFLTVFPYLKKNAVIVLHDIILNLFDMKNYACKLLFDAVDADKFWCVDETRELGGLSNIGAFQINDSTSRSVNKVFSALCIKWDYLPDESQIFSYIDHFAKYYNSYQIHLFDLALKANIIRKSVEKTKKYEFKKKHPFRWVCPYFRAFAFKASAI